MPNNCFILTVHKFIRPYMYGIVTIDPPWLRGITGMPIQGNRRDLNPRHLAQRGAGT